MEVACLTGVRHWRGGADPETIEGIDFYRTPKPAPAPSPLAGMARDQGARGAARRAGRSVEAGPAPRPLAGPQRARGAAGGEAPRPAAHLRDPRLLGGCGGRQRDRARRLGPLPADPDVRDLGRPPGRRGRRDLRGAEARPDRPRHPGGEDHRRAQRSRPHPVRQPARRRPRPRPQARPRRRRRGRLHRLLLRL